MPGRAPELTQRQVADLDRLFAQHTSLPGSVSAVRCAPRVALMLRYVFHAPRDVRRQALYLEDRDIRPATSREAFFLAVTRTLCSPLEPENWRALCNGQAFLFDLGPAVFRFTRIPSQSDPERAHWHFGKIIFEEPPPALAQSGSDPGLNPLGEHEPGANPL